jgi:hypothetical protein
MEVCYDGVIFSCWFSFVLAAMIYFSVWLPSCPSPDNEANSSSPGPTDTELLSGLPATYYGLAILCGVVLIGFTIANADELSSTEIGEWVGYTVGAVLSMFAVGRVIQLLEDIRDAVRNTPALSPSRPDDE